MSPKKTYEELLKENELFREIIDRVHEAVYVVDEKDQVIIFNKGMERIEGMRQEDTVGRSEIDVYSFIESTTYNEAVTQPIKKRKKPLIDQVYSFNIPDGRTIHFQFDAYPYIRNKKIKAVYSIGRTMEQIKDFIASTTEKHNEIARKNNSAVKARYFLSDIIGKSKSIRNAVKLAKRVATHSSPILIYGKTGTGKELFAQGIHNASTYAMGPFVPINCAAIPETLLEATLFGTEKGAFTGAMEMPGLFEQAASGTLFLDEINSMPKGLQAKLLRALQERVVRRLGGKRDIEVGCRVLSACNKDPFEGNEIRKDLLFRISTVIINIAPLCERKEDIAELAYSFIRKFNSKFSLFVKQISPELLEALQNYEWPGNVRELENAIETIMIVAEFTTYQLEINHLPPYLKARLSIEHDEPDEPEPVDDDIEEAVEDQATLREKLIDFEKRLVEDTLHKHKGNVTKAARELGVQRQNLHYRIRRFGLRTVPEDGSGE